MSVFILGRVDFANIVVEKVSDLDFRLRPSIVNDDTKKRNVIPMKSPTWILAAGGFG